MRAFLLLRAFSYRLIVEVQEALPPVGVRGLPAPGQVIHEKPSFLFAAAGGEKKKICSGDTPENPAKAQLEAWARRVDAIGKVENHDFSLNCQRH